MKKKLIIANKIKVNSHQIHLKGHFSKNKLYKFASGTHLLWKDWSMDDRVFWPLFYEITHLMIRLHCCYFLVCVLFSIIIHYLSESLLGAFASCSILSIITIRGIHCQIQIRIHWWKTLEEWCYIILMNTTLGAFINYVEKQGEGFAQMSTILHKLI